MDEPKAKAEAPIYKFSWRRFTFITVSLITLPIWAPWVKEHVSREAMMLLVPFVLIFVGSLAYVLVAFPTKSIRQNERRDKSDFDETNSL